MLFSTVNPQKTCQNLENFRAPRGVLFFLIFPFQILGAGFYFFVTSTQFFSGGIMLTGGGLKLTPW